MTIACKSPAKAVCETTFAHLGFRSDRSQWRLSFTETTRYHVDGVALSFLLLLLLTPRRYVIKVLHEWKLWKWLCSRHLFDNLKY